MPLFCETVFYIFNMFVIADQSQRGSLFPLFLNNPLMAFYLSLDCQACVEAYGKSVKNIFEKSAATLPSY